MHPASTLHRLRTALHQLRDSVELHPHRVAAGVGALLLAGSSIAWGLARFGPQPELPAASQLSIPLSLDLAAQAQALQSQPQALSTSTEVRAADSAESLLRRLQVTDPAQLTQLARLPALRQLLAAPGQLVTAQVSSLGQLTQLQACLPLTDQAGGKRPATDPAAVTDSGQPPLQLRINANADSGFTTAIGQAPLQTRLRLFSGVLRGGLYATADASGMPDAVVGQLVGLFAGELNFRRDLRDGDRFSVVVQSREAAGQNLSADKIVAARIDSASAGSHSAVWFNPPGHPEAAGYFNPHGDALAHSFLLSPLPYDRLTSGWGWRISPIFNQPEFHLGIDLAIPVGTPVRSVADGRVSFAGSGRGYGLYVKVDHAGGYASLYSHLDRLGVRVGQQVTQGEQVALSGNSGWSTGPHLYWQFFVHGQPVNPQNIGQYAARANPVPAALRPAFAAQIAQPQRLLAMVPGAERQAAAAPQPRS